MSKIKTKKDTLFLTLGRTAHISCKNVNSEFVVDSENIEEFSNKSLVFENCIVVGYVASSPKKTKNKGYTFLISDESKQVMRVYVESPESVKSYENNGNVQTRNLKWYSHYGSDQKSEGTIPDGNIKVEDDDDEDEDEEEEEEEEEEDEDEDDNIASNNHKNIATTNGRQDSGVDGDNNADSNTNVNGVKSEDMEVDTDNCGSADGHTKDDDDNNNNNNSNESEKQTIYDELSNMYGSSYKFGVEKAITMKGLRDTVKYVKGLKIGTPVMCYGKPFKEPQATLKWSLKEFMSAYEQNSETFEKTIFKESGFEAYQPFSYMRTVYVRTLSNDRLKQMQTFSSMVTFLHSSYGIEEGETIEKFNNSANHTNANIIRKNKVSNSDSIRQAINLGGRIRDGNNSVKVKSEKVDSSNNNNNDDDDDEEKKRDMESKKRKLSIRDMLKK